MTMDSATFNYTLFFSLNTSLWRLSGITDLQNLQNDHHQDISNDVLEERYSAELVRMLRKPNIWSLFASCLCLLLHGLGFIFW